MADGADAIGAVDRRRFVRAGIAAAVIALACAVAWSRHVARQRLVALAATAERDGDGPSLAVAMAGLDGSRASLWSAAVALESDPQPAGAWAAHASAVTALGMSRDGLRVVTGSAAGTVATWSWDGSLLERLGAHDGTVTCAALDDSGAWSGGSDGVRRWGSPGPQRIEFRDDRPIAMESLEDGVVGVSLLRQGDIVIRAGESAWAPRTADRSARDDFPAVARSADGRVTASFAGDIVEVTADGGAVTRFTTGRRVTSLALDRQGKLLLTGGDDGSVSAWRLREAPSRRCVAHAGSFGALAFLPDGELLVAAAGATGPFAIVEGSAWPGARLLPGIVAAVADERVGCLVTADERGFLTTWPLPLAESRRTWRCSDARPLALAIDAPARQVWTAAADGSIAHWSLDDGRELGRLERTASAVMGLALAGGGLRVLACEEVGDVVAWDRTTGAPRVLLSTGEPLQCLAWNEARRVLAAGDRTGRVHLAGENGHAVLQVGGRVSCVAFQPSGSLLAAAADDGVTLWEVDSGERVAFRRFPGACSLAWSSDGRRLATGSVEGCVAVLAMPAEANARGVREELERRGLSLDRVTVRQAIGATGEPPLP